MGFIGVSLVRFDKGSGAGGVPDMEEPQQETCRELHVLRERGQALAVKTRTGSSFQKAGVCLVVSAEMWSPISCPSEAMRRLWIGRPA